MSAPAVSDPTITVEDYLASEALAEVKHEYLGGVVYAMAGASEAHNIIAMNLYMGLGNRLRGRPCRPFGSDMKVRLRPLDDTYFYYPDAMIACDSTDAGHGWRERPAALFEIISEETRRIDEREKRIPYLQLPSLQAYVRVEQDRPEVVVERRTPDGWKSERLRGLDAVVRLPALEIELPLAELYERVSFPD
jgi:Uma2 family endonuclease